jgi:hypothetical protein
MTYLIVGIILILSCAKKSTHEAPGGSTQVLTYAHR